MVISQPLPFVRQFVEALDAGLATYHPGWHLSRLQKAWLAFCVMAVLLTNQINWAQFERTSLGGHRMAALSWMFRRSKLLWERLLPMSVRLTLASYGIGEGVLVIDESNKQRSKHTSKLAYVHKLKDPSTGGYFMGQAPLFLLLVTPLITLPVSFAFYQPDPVWKAWQKKEKVLKAQGIPAGNRPSKPPRDPAYPTKQELALSLLRQFRADHPDLTIRVILADALYGTAAFMDTAARLFGGIQVISQLHANQKVRYRSQILSLQQYVARHPATPQMIAPRGGEARTVWVTSARLYVTAHQAKRFVIALKYEGEQEYRYLVARDLTWRTLDIVQAYTFRWLVEVFLQDWKAHEGWDHLTKQQGEEGSRRSLILSLLVDHSLFFHPRQKARLQNKLSAYTVGSLQQHLSEEALLAFIQDLIAADDLHLQVEQLARLLKERIDTLRPSTKHMVGREMGPLKPAPSLKYRASA
jgi:hypothetical protein